MMCRLRERAVALTYTAGWFVVRWLPEPLARALFNLVADVCWRRQGRGVRQLAVNLRRVVGEDATERRVGELTRAAMRSYCRYWREVFRLSVMSRERIASRFNLRDGGLLWEALGSGRGVILALPHSGNWDHAGAWMALSGHPFTTVAERLRPGSLYDRFVRFRERLGMEVLPLTGVSSPYAVLADRLRDGRLVCLLADRDLTATGVDVTFFGDAARMPAGPAALAFDTGAALLPVTLWYEGTAWAGRIHEEITVPPSGTREERIERMTQAMATAFEATIAAHPQDWHMLQRLWTADVDPTGAEQPEDTVAGGEHATRVGVGRRRDAGE